MPNPKAVTKDGKVVGTNVLNEEFTVKFKNVGVSRHKQGSISLPEGMSVSEGAHWLNEILREEEKIVEVRENLFGFPMDCARALQLAVEEMFGVKEMRSTPGFFSFDPPAASNIPVNYKGDTITVYTGRFSVPEYASETEYDRKNNYIQTYPAEGSMEALVVETRTKNRNIPLFNRLVALARQKLLTDSIYRGKAFRLTTEDIRDKNGNITKVNHPEFLDVENIPADLALNADTTRLIENGIWTPIQRTEDVRYYNGGNVRTGALLYGDPGTGKSLTALATAKIAQENGWTFILCKDSRLLPSVYKLALRYAPVVLFAEDIDMLVRLSSPDAVNVFNNILDGVDSKTCDIITILTTNHIDVLPPVMLRPGRFDAVVRYEAPNAATAVKLVRSYLRDQIDETNFNEAVIGNLLKDKVPAVIHEVCKRAGRTAIRRYDKGYRGVLSITTEDIRISTMGMEEHMALLRGQTGPEQVHPIIAFGEAVGSGIAKTTSAAAASAGLRVIRLPEVGQEVLEMLKGAQVPGGPVNGVVSEVAKAATQGQG